MGWRQVAAGIQAAAAIATSTPSTEPVQRAAEDYSDHQKSSSQQQQVNTSAGIAANDADKNTPADQRPK